MLHCHLPHHMMNAMISMVGPMQHCGKGLHTGAGMEEGLGIVRQTNAFSEELGPALGRGLGVAADAERGTSALVGQQHGHAQDRLATGHQEGPDEKRVPGYPQDMWMPMDEMFNDKPENYGLRKGWSGAMMGMMTLVRVLTPEMYDKIMELKRQQRQPKQEKQHEHSGHEQK